MGPLEYLAGRIFGHEAVLCKYLVWLCVYRGGGGDRESLWYRYQLIRYQVPPQFKVLVPPILGKKELITDN